MSRRRYNFKAKPRRVWAGYAIANAPGWSFPGGGDGDTACPRERSMNSVKLRQEDENQSRRRCLTRQRNQRKIFWYIQWSRDWNWRKIATATNIQPEKTGSSVTISFDSGDPMAEETVFSWQWRAYVAARRKLKSKKGIPKKFSALVKWSTLINSRDNDDENEAYH